MDASGIGMSGPQVVLDELNHRFLNSLQIIATLAAMHPHDDALEPGAGLRLARLRACIGALGRLHRQLASPHADSFEDGGAEICGALTEAFGRPVALTLSVEEEPEDPSLSRGLLLVLTELMTNALKHAWAEPLVVEVALARSGRGWRLRVDSNTRGARGRPRVAAALAEWLGGELSVDAGAGFAVSVALPACARAALPSVCV